MSKVKGRHALTWGGTIYRIWVNTNSTAKPTMQFNSPQEFVNDQLSTVTIVNATPGNGVRATQIGLFVNDKFQVLPTLSLDLGLRYDIETVPHDSRYATRPYDTRTGTLGPPGDPYFAINNKDFGPRVGIAWSPKPRFVIRSGYGIYFQDYPVGFGQLVPGNTVPGNVTLLQQQIPNLSYPYDPFLSQAAAPASAKRRGISVAQAGHLRESVEPECRRSVIAEYVLPGRLRRQPRRESVARRGHQLLRSHARRSSEPELRQHHPPDQLGLQLLQRSAALLYSPCGQGWFELPGKLHLRPRD